MLFNIYLCCFAIGVIYTLVTTFINGVVSAIDLHTHMDGHIDSHIDGHIDGHIDHNIDIHADHHIEGHLDVHADAHSDSNIHTHANAHTDVHASLGGLHAGGTHIGLGLPIRPFTIMILITVFGGMGIIFTNIFSGEGFLPTRLLWDAVSFPLSFICAYVVAKFMYHTVYESLVRAQSTTTRSESDAIGLQAEVVVAISPMLKGKVSYIVNETLLSSPAKPYFPSTNGYPQGAKVVIKDIQDHVCLVDDWQEPDYKSFSGYHN